jgi:hypothetical protein
MLFREIITVCSEKHKKTIYVLWIKCTGVLPWLTWLVAGLSPQRQGFTTRSVHVGFVVDKVTLGQFFSEFFHFPLSVSLYHGSPYSYNVGDEQ